MKYLKVNYFKINSSLIICFYLAIPITTTTPDPTVDPIGNTTNTTIATTTTQTITTTTTPSIQTPNSNKPTQSYYVYPSPTIAFKLVISVTCNETQSEDIENLENFEKALYIFFLKYFNELDKVKVESFMCNNSVPFNISSKVTDNQSISKLNSSIENFKKKLAYESSKVELVTELESIVLSKSGINVGANIDAWIGNLNEQSIQSDICPRISCFNKYFKLNCNTKNEDKIICEHICDNQTPYCKNDAKCIPLYDKDFKPQCM